jgi:hypothetical protein
MRRAVVAVGITGQTRPAIRIHRSVRPKPATGVQGDDLVRHLRPIVSRTSQYVRTGSPAPSCLPFKKIRRSDVSRQRNPVEFRFNRYAAAAPCPAGCGRLNTG